MFDPSMSPVEGSVVVGDQLEAVSEGYAPMTKAK
jgi:hypothetical protein